MPRRILLPFACAAIVALLVFHSTPPSAQPSDATGSEPVQAKVRLSYGGPDECPAPGAFRAAVARRLSIDWEAPPGELARRIDVVVSRVADGYGATIELLDAAGQRLRRAVRGRDCADVVDGIALVTALAIESRIDEALDRSEPEKSPGSSPNATPARTPAPLPGASAPTNAAPPVRATGGTPVAGTPAVAEPSPGAPRGAPAAVASGTETSAPGAAPAGPSVPLQWRASLRAGFATGIAPRLAPGVGVAAVLEYGAARFGLAFLGFSSGRVTASGVEARFDLVTSRLEGCPSAIELASSMALELCASFDAGVLSGRGYSDPPTVAEGQSGLSPWLAPGAVARLVGSFGQLVVEFEGGARFPLRREEFFVDSGEGAGETRISVHEVPATSLGAALGLGLHF